MFLFKTVEKYLLRSKLSLKHFSTERMVNPIVSVTQGKLKGSISNLLDGSPYYSFKGIPYAQPPVGKLRFRAPLPVEPWEGIRDALEHGPVCPQYDMNSTEILEGNEDCLFLNVYTRSLEPNSKTPVIVYIHGGAFMSGSGDSTTYGPEFLLQHNVILVTINFRLEALGFLCLETPEVPGNAGVKDQVMALRWVQENISKFGGDSANVTIMGESAGAAAVTYHMLSPMSKGLFHKAIAQSGVALADWATGHESVERAFRLGKNLGKETKDVNELLEFFQNVPAIDFAGGTRNARTPDEHFRGLPIHFTPVVEKKFDGVEPFLTENATDMLLEGKIHKVPLLIGYNSAEGVLMVPDSLKKKKILNEDPSLLVPRGIMLKVSKEKLKEFGQCIKTFYYGGKDFDSKMIAAITDLQSDLHFTFPVHRFINFYHKYAPVYFYRFDYQTKLNILKALVGLNVNGACHADDLFYLFNSMVIADYYQEDEKLQKIVYQLTKFWTDFAKTGNPTPDAEGIQWPQYTASGENYIALNERQLSVERHADKERMDFWNKLYCDAGLPYYTKSHI